MKCPRCGRDTQERAGAASPGAPADSDAPRGDRCPECGQAPVSPRPGAGDWRPVTSLVDKPVDPAMIDETPPPRPRDIPELAQGGPDDPQAGRRSLGSEELEESAPISPGDLGAGAGDAAAFDVGPAPEVPPEARGTAAGSGGEIPDFGEARQVSGEAGQARPNAGDAGSPPPPPPGAADRWESVRVNVRRQAPELARKGGFVVRVAAVLLDTIFLTAVGWAVFMVVFAATGLQDLFLANLDAFEADPEGTFELLRPALEPYTGVFAIAYAALSLVSFLYRPLCHATWGKTLGKFIFRLRVVTTEGGPIGLRKSFLRYLGYIISLLPFGLGVLWVVYDPQKQGWHDKMAGTYVIKERG